MDTLFQSIPGEKQIIISRILQKQNNIRSAKDVLKICFINYFKLPCIILV